MRVSAAELRSEPYTGCRKIEQRQAHLLPTLRIGEGGTKRSERVLRHIGDSGHIIETGRL